MIPWRQSRLTTLLILGATLLAIATSAPAQKRNWYFNTDANAEGWDQSRHSTTVPVATGGALGFAITGPDPYVFSPSNLNLPLDQYKYLKIVMKTDFSSPQGRIYWATTSSPTWGEDKGFDFVVKQSDTFQTYYLLIGSNPLWSTTLTRFRIDPTGASTGNVSIDEVSLLTADEMPPWAEIASFSPSNSLLMVAGQPTTLSALVRNTGVNTIQNMVLDLQLPAGCSLVSGSLSTTIPSLAVGSEQPVTWTIQCVGALNGEAKLTASVGGQMLATKKAPLFGVSQIVDPPQNAPAGLQYVDSASYLILANDTVRLLIQKESVPTPRYGPIHYEYYKSGAWRRIATCPAFSSTVYDGTALRGAFASLTPRTLTVEVQTAALIRVRFSGAETDSEGRTFNYVYRVSLRNASAQADFAWQVSATQPFGLTRFDGPVFFCGNDAAQPRDEAIFPGLEFLEKDERSSSDAYDHSAEHVRYVPHPYKVTQPTMALRFGDVLLAGIWDINQAWDAAGDKLPLAFFASPDTYYGWTQSHIMGLFLPGFGPGFAENQREAATPHAVASAENLMLNFSLWLKTDSASATEATSYYFAQHPLPEPDVFPYGGIQGSYKRSMEAFMDSLWLPADQGME